MGLTHFPNGISSFGMPTFGTSPDVVTGSVFFVDSTTGSNVNSGTDTSNALATLDKALDKCTADKGDRIYLMPKHSETITGAGGITLDKAGVSIIGLGNYNQRPAFLMDGADTVTCLVTAADVSIENIVFKAGHADVAIWGLITGVGCTIKNCRFVENVATENWVDCIHAGATDNDYDGLKLIGNEFIMNDASCVTAIDLLKNSADVQIIGNKITGDFDATPYAPIYSVSSEIHTNIEIAYNLIHNVHDDNSLAGISVGSTGSTGWMHHNLVYSLDVAGCTPFVSAATGIAVFENYYNYTGSTSSAVLAPAAGTLS
jgi:hypothetical protein